MMNDYPWDLWGAFALVCILIAMLPYIAQAFAWCICWTLEKLKF